MQIRSIVQGFFYGNYFYGLCAVALSIEATLQQVYPLASPDYYLAIFALTTWYYTLPYVKGDESSGKDPRSKWYQQHRAWVRCSQRVLLLICCAYALYFLFRYAGAMLQMSSTQWGLALSVPFLGLAYYGISFNEQYNLRKIGLLKPFVIGFCWAAICTIYPILWHKITHQEAGALSGIGYRLFIKNLMYIALIGIMFDIKDYATDAKQQLNTIVVQRGLRNTLYNVLLPLSIVGLATFWIYGFTHDFSAMKIGLNTLPFIAMFFAVQALKKRRSILYYLVIIDGLLLVKAICGSIGMIYF